ncbi:class I SAM-dependent methyltransferase [Antarcticibacterium flavum]|uniref:Class I SAM-dependent methyltransferase n=1 Tax=Antarcticibacterium flavum TaxID=2058175 RepID=A0A5B7WY98_9FLAO|nr:rRNA adenine N-6-methyltransferase family protein [Antarcticibacterium flavum]MCM4158835.1 SAM-dependent methyltransferase [Antarcticibacterium sp. W02-3]QCY68099.1 class I SAM-dependent methyltransferase [Antarcticibacterium flavum]
MNKALLQQDVQSFIKENAGLDISKLLLKGSPFKKVTASELATQITARKKAEKKLPTWYSSSNIIYPPGLNLEQTSSEVTARYKAQLIKGESLIDLTGGLGIDSFFLAEKFEQLTHCEKDSSLSEIATHNFKELGAKNITTVTGDSLEFLRSSTNKFDWIYIDPARRDDYGGKIFLLEQCTPNVPLNLNLFFEKAQRILIKTSPLLDLKAGLGELEQVKEIHIVAVDNDVKELIWLLEPGTTGKVRLKTTNFRKHDIQEFEADFSKLTIEPVLNEPGTFLYEPNAAIMKSGLFGELSLQTGTAKLHANSHLYTSNSLFDFPGRRFKIVDVLPYNRKLLKKDPRLKKANITTRNFPKSVEAIRKELKIEDGGTVYAFFTTNLHNEKVVLLCEKV